jgi:uncharacterized protein (TIGR03067 family)
LAADGRKGDVDHRTTLQGTWYVLSLVNDAKPIPDKATKGPMLIFEGDHYALHEAKHNSCGKFTLDQGKRPRHIDTTYTEAKTREKGTTRGISELKGDQLTIAWREGGKDRPKQFTSTPGSKVCLVVLCRTKK